MDMEIDVKEFIRKLQLKEIFHSYKPSQNDSIVKHASDFLPQLENVKNPLLKNVCQRLSSTAENLNNLQTENEVHQNISKSESIALNKLKNDDSIVIKEADKGGSVIIMDRDYYINKIESMLNNKTVFTKHPDNCDNKNMAKVKKFANDKKYKNILTPDEKSYISNFEFKTANYYGLPKVHKSQSIKNLVSNTTECCVNLKNPEDLKFRGITSGIDSPTSHLSELLNKILKPYVIKVVKTHIRDSTDFINKLNRCENEDIDDILLTTVDIVDMYPSINKSIGLKAIRFFLDKYPDILKEHYPNRNFNTDFIIEGLKIVLDNNLVQFNDKFYSQKRGTVTGTVVAPTYATLTVAYLEVKLEEKLNEIYNEQQTDYIISNFKRFLDDGFIPWKKSFGTIDGFIDILNSLDDQIKFTHETNDKQISYLNVTIYKDGPTLKCDIYYKETDNRQYLHFNSCHPHHNKINVPFTLAKMICTIVDDRDICLKRLEELKHYLRKCRYPWKVINNGCTKAYAIDVTDLRTLKDKTEEDVISFVTTHNPHNPNISIKINNAYESLLDDENMKKIFGKTKLIKSFKEPPSLKDLLTNSCLRNTHPTPGVSKCGTNSCKTCDEILQTDNYYFHEVDYTFHLKCALDCSAKNCIYALTCENCGDYYIGKTTYLRKRMSKHRRAIEDEMQRVQEVSKHIADCCASPSYSVIPFYKVKRHGATALEATEEYFIRKFKPVLNRRI